MTNKPKLGDRIWLVSDGKIIEGIIWKIEENLAIRGENVFSKYYISYNGTYYYVEAILGEDFFLSEEDCFKTKKCELEKYLNDVSQAAKYYSNKLEKLTILIDNYKKSYDK